METTVVDDPAAGRIEIHVDGALGGFAAYKRTDSTLSLTHTEIDPDFAGRGLGSVLARGALDGARADGLAVLPYCPFISGYIRRHGEYLDLVPEADRARFGLGRLR